MDKTYSRNIIVLLTICYLLSFACPSTSTTPQLIRQFPESSPLPGNACSTSGGLLSPPTVCPSPLTCILISFGFPAVDNPTVGTCAQAPDPLLPCTVGFCSSTPTDQAICEVTGQTATCNAWATRMDGGLGRPDCSFACTEECMIPQLIASDGSTHCNQCKLSQASCLADFTFYGPVGGACENPSIFDQAKCCIEQQKGCIPVGGQCSTAGSRIQPVPCVEGASCVIDDFGFPAVDIPNSGVCTEIDSENVRRCNVKFCARKGSDRICQLASENIITTCGAWSNRDDNGRKPSCTTSCNHGCGKLKSKRPIGSDGEIYCNHCFLRKKSCLSGFTVYGPV